MTTLHRLLLALPVLILIVVSGSLAGQSGSDSAVTVEYIETDGWDQDDLPGIEGSRKNSGALVSPIRLLSLALIDVYQKRVSPNSITNRCPFKTSCSHFAYRTISERGFIMGVLLFIDRYYFRENASSPQNYLFFENKEGVLRLDDDFYLKGE